ncbi:hypothetical protein VNO78_16008 [Psophocarpus tetragonolobus]|uniref:Uncharacterized protein n=1 Tax=Psophocarpus tetragonolobus TaxID=3891 RepID=A0AAN9SH26_PSOTE
MRNRWEEEPQDATRTIQSNASLKTQRAWIKGLRGLPPNPKTKLQLPHALNTPSWPRIPEATAPHKITQVSPLSSSIQANTLPTNLFASITQTSTITPLLPLLKNAQEPSKMTSMAITTLVEEMLAFVHTLVKQQSLMEHEILPKKFWHHRSCHSPSQTLPLQCRRLPQPCFLRCGRPPHSRLRCHLASQARPQRHRH